MAVVVLNVRRRERRFTTPGQVPTIPTAPDHNDPGWLATDLYDGEWCVNTADHKIYMRSANTILDISALSAGLNWGLITGNLSDQTDLQDALDDLQNQIDGIQTGVGILRDIGNGQYVWTGGLDFVGGSTVLEQPDGTLVNVAGNPFSSPANNSGDPRQDAIIIGDDGVWKTKQGVPSPDPATPVIDPLTEVLKGYILIPDGAAQPTGLTTLVLYDENLGVSGGEGGDFFTNDVPNIDPDSTTNPPRGAKCVEVLNASSSQRYGWNNFNAPIPADDISKVSFDVRIDSGAGTLARIYVFLNGTPASGKYGYAYAQHNQHGYDKNVKDAVQTITFDISNFTWPNGKVDVVELEMLHTVQGAAPTFRVDYVEIQGGLDPVPTTVDIFKFVEAEDGTQITAVGSTDTVEVVGDGLLRTTVEAGKLKVTARGQAYTELTSAGNELAWDVAANTRFFHELTEVTEVQLPTNFNPGDEFTFTVRHDGVSSISFKPGVGFRKFEGNDIDLDNSHGAGDEFEYTMRVDKDGAFIDVVNSGKKEVV